MKKKIIKKRKLKVWNFLLALIILGVISFSCFYFINKPIKNIIIKNNNYLTDDYIIDNSGIRNYPSFLLINTKSIRKKLLKSDYILDVKISRKFYNVLVIQVKENKPLFYNTTNNSIVFNNKKEVSIDSFDLSLRIPRLINYVPDDKYNSFIKGINKINDDVLGRISDIEYQPNEYDKDRFLLYMDDGNMVYLTLTKFKAINYYNDVLSQLDNRKGILYLDSGNHFQVKE